MRKRRPSRIFMLIILVLVAVTVGPRVHTWWQLKSQEKDLLAEKNKLMEINQKLSHEVEKLESLSAVEKLAREKLGMIKPGEQRFIEFSSPENNNGN